MCKYFNYSAFNIKKLNTHIVEVKLISTRIKSGCFITNKKWQRKWTKRFENNSI